MSDWMEEYATTDNLNRKYGLLRTEITRLRGQREEIEFYDPDEVMKDVRQWNKTLSGDLIVFVANDFGLPKAYRPQDLDKAVQNKIRESILQNKYDSTNEDLNEIRRELLDKHLGIHKAIIAQHEDGEVRYHLPEGSNETTNFITVREMIGLIDYTTNSFQSDNQSVTY